MSNRHPKISIPKLEEMEMKQLFSLLLAVKTFRLNLLYVIRKPCFASTGSARHLDECLDFWVAGRSPENPKHNGSCCREAYQVTIASGS